ncbi:uncharacterized protein LOC132601402 [Lycium barbarum]|uniref:uncharacterized protein LOC132601402 n=1 Tax=Lycium barbarum TaxID=112863 RepID=UPI00293F45D9|nr:uncharacterized protein LOC132601402 [Lycium barbarum]
MEFTRDELYTVPIWIKLPGLDFKYWSVKGLSKLGSLVGKPLMVDQNTEKKRGLHFARLLVEVKMGAKLPDTILFRNERDTIVEQKVMYDWKPTLCNLCQKYGHSEGECRRKNAPKPKKPTVVQVDKEMTDAAPQKPPVDAAPQKPVHAQNKLAVADVATSVTVPLRAVTPKTPSNPNMRTAQQGQNQRTGKKQVLTAWVTPLNPSRAPGKSQTQETSQNTYQVLQQLESGQEGVDNMGGNTIPQKGNG